MGAKQQQPGAKHALRKFASAVCTATFIGAFCTSYGLLWLAACRSFSFCSTSAAILWPHHLSLALVSPSARQPASSSAHRLVVSVPCPGFRS